MSGRVIRFPRSRVRRARRGDSARAGLIVAFPERVALSDEQLTKEIKRHINDAIAALHEIEAEKRKGR